MNSWRWSSAQRTPANHCGEPGKIYLDVPEPASKPSFSMLEDGFEFAQWIVTLNPALQPSTGCRNGSLPELTYKHGKLF